MRAAVERLGAPPLSPPLRSTGKWDDEAFNRDLLTDLGFTDIALVSYEFEANVGTALYFADNFRLLFPPLIMGWTQEEKDEFGPRIEASLEEVIEEKAGKGDYMLKMTALIVTASKADRK